MTNKERILSAYRFPTTTDSRGRYRIWVKTAEGRKQLYAMSIPELKDKVYRHETGLKGYCEPLTFKEAFEEAQYFELDNTNEIYSYSKANTVMKNYYTYRRFFSGSELENLPFERIEVCHLDTFIRSILQHELLTKNSLLAIRDIISLVYKRACFNGYISHNVAKDIIWTDYYHFLREPAPLELRVFSDNELSAMDEYIRLHQETYPAYIPAYALEFQRLTGMRRGELPPLLWEDVDFDRKRLFIHREQIATKIDGKCKDVIVDYTKTKRSRYYPIADMEMFFLMKLYRIHHVFYRDSPFLFPADNENGCISSHVVYCFHYRMCKKLNISTDNNCRRGTHAFRRSAITETVNNSNGNVVLAAKMYGNSPETIRNHYYTTDSLEHMRDILNKRVYSTLQPALSEKGLK